MPPNAAFAPFDVTYNWTEHRDGRFVTRSHNKRDERPPHRYRLNVTGRRDPTENRVQINWPAFSRDGTTLRQGYPDGTQVGPAFELAKVSSRWGKNLARTRSYEAWSVRGAALQAILRIAGASLLLGCGFQQTQGSGRPTDGTTRLVGPEDPAVFGFGWLGCPGQQ